MSRLYLVLAFCLLMATLIPLASVMAVSPSTPTYTHFVYMFGHANILHWLINAWSFLVLHNVLRWYRLLTAYLLSVTLSFLISHFSCSSSAAPTIGASVLTCFFFGFIAPWLWQRQKVAVLMMLLLILAGFFLSGFAAGYHLIMFISGLIASYIEHFIRSFITFSST